MIVRGKKDGLPICEYEVRDWINGSLPNGLIPGRYKLVERKSQRRIDLIRRKAHVPIRYDFISAETYRVIHSRQEKEYWKLVESNYAALQDGFRISLFNSADKKRLYLRELAKVKYILLPESRSDYSVPVVENLSQFDNFPFLYDRLILRGQRDYSIIPKPGNVYKEKFDFIHVEANAIYLNWLESISIDDPASMGIGKVPDLKEPSKDESKKSELDVLSEDKTKQVISQKFDEEFSEGWQEVLRSEDDYDTLVNCLCSFFQGNLDFPTVQISVKQRKQTKLGKFFKSIHDELGQNVLRSEEKYFKLIQGISAFNHLNENDIYKALIR